MQAQAAHEMLGRALDFEGFGSSAVDYGTVIAIASNGLISAIAPTPQIDASIEATLHMDRRQARFRMALPAISTTRRGTCCKPTRWL